MLIESSHMNANFMLNPPRGSSLFSLLGWQGRPISYNDKVVGRADKVDVKTDGRVIITADLDATYANKQLGLDFILRD